MDTIKRFFFERVVRLPRSKVMAPGLLELKRLDNVFRLQTYDFIFR